jgi:hypothetical protein
MVDIVGSAKFVGEVVITGYDSAGRLINFQSLEFPDTVSQSFCETCVRGRKPNSRYMAGNLPYIGDTVLIVLPDFESLFWTYRKHLLFGIKEGDAYRIWLSSRLAYHTILEEDILYTEFLPDHFENTCLWKCFVPIQDLDEFVKHYQELYRLKLQMRQELLMIPIQDFAGLQLQEVLYQRLDIKHNRVMTGSFRASYQSEKEVIVLSHLDKDIRLTLAEPPEFGWEPIGDDEWDTMSKLLNDPQVVKAEWVDGGQSHYPFLSKSR